jgi:hypothetical protein
MTNRTGTEGKFSLPQETAMVPSLKNPWNRMIRVAGKDLL